ncbi:MAG: HEAT repeat domain-containing protein [Deltaproteobacteria bacterium]|nr:HEAT repeat domain-containing protein [Deltaproteobacteria bacterium]
MHNFYPEGHPQLDSALEKCYLLLKKTIDAQGEIKWKIDQKGFYDNRTIIGGDNPEIAAFAKKFFYRRVNELAFNPRLTLPELKIFLSILKLEPEELQAKGGAEAVFAENDIRGILLNELNYEDLLKIREDLEEEREKERREIAEKNEEAASGEAAQGGEEKEQSPPVEPEEEEPLSVLLDRIKTERDFLRYNDLSVRIKEKASILLIEKKLDEAFPAALAFYQHISPFSGLDQNIRSTASERLSSLLNRDMMKYLAGRVGRREEPCRSAIQQMLVISGSEAAEFLLDEIIAAPEALIRRNLFNAIVLFGKAVKHQVEERLYKSPEWFVVRQMVALLGEVGDEGSLDSIEAAYNNPEARVKREVLKSLIKIQSPRSTAMLLRTLEEEDEALVTQAIMSLGMLKDSSVIDILGGIALKRGSDSLEIKKEAIKALGIIGHPKAVPFLTRILFKRVWFGKKANEEARSLAAYSLGLIGTNDAYEALKEACEGSSGELHTACKRILEKREKDR